MHIVIIDTGCSNLFSVATAIHNLGYHSTISQDVNCISQADKLFLPGVGTAQSAMQQLNKKKIINLIKTCKQPILGICLGMQLFGSSSDENGGITTLNVINIPTKKINVNKLPLPHMGWNKVTVKNKHYLFHNIKNNNYFYFVHNYAMPLCNETIAKSHYGSSFTAAIAYKNFFGVQFHPEKSGYAGKQLIKNFLEIEI
ncbi:imidazole glycerol phosphate synthase subunit HisH [Blochmannia endosymbiont of Camponotus (Colobopsis) obliquus]|uniref:imidazole glycerol phosphate synthase subunit HisH n=1 Tax=Blochmannia endosymbiont of Camponotus (Colobopsis) obliquus TaxID=1505597 RepID=UPI00061A59BF|nr:imidazole glycerol phosphate synthase subunit HisH [Blochmannia endosymbiont of Camponotus (Colobopsis) obliquus]AKC60618.1 imidazole glycerol phosphate synthase, glutamine amidotransferase subunit [Blochmannia endosymbiont of Camponotus (Colobopsis) obliquus]